MAKHLDNGAALLARLQRKTFQYFWTEVNPANGLVVDSTKEGWPASIAAIGMALAIYPIGVERSFITRKEAVTRILTTLLFFWHSSQGTAAGATGYRGFYYHFLDMKTGKRVGTVNSRPLIRHSSRRRINFGALFLHDSEAEK